MLGRAMLTCAAESARCGAGCWLADARLPPRLATRDSTPPFAPATTKAVAGVRAVRGPMWSWTERARAARSGVFSLHCAGGRKRYSAAPADGAFVAPAKGRWERPRSYVGWEVPVPTVGCMSEMKWSTSGFLRSWAGREGRRGVPPPPMRDVPSTVVHRVPRNNQRRTITISSCDMRPPSRGRLSHATFPLRLHAFSRTQHTVRLQISWHPSRYMPCLVCLPACAGSRPIAQTATSAGDRRTPSLSAEF